ncbi:hypothetical protein TREMEDRAFT_55857, partial [Tremella mesenterica DSM 1558]
MLFPSTLPLLLASTALAFPNAKRHRSNFKRIYRQRDDPEPVITAAPSTSTFTGIPVATSTPPVSAYGLSPFAGTNSTGPETSNSTNVGKNPEDADPGGISNSSVSALLASTSVFNTFTYSDYTPATTAASAVVTGGSGNGNEDDGTDDESDYGSEGDDDEDGTNQDGGGTGNSNTSSSGVDGTAGSGGNGQNGGTSSSGMVNGGNYDSLGGALESYIDNALENALPTLTVEVILVPTKEPDGHWDYVYHLGSDGTVTSSPTFIPSLASPTSASFTANIASSLAPVSSTPVVSSAYTPSTSTASSTLSTSGSSSQTIPSSSSSVSNTGSSAGDTNSGNSGSNGSNYSGGA